MVAFTRVTLPLALLLQARGEWLEIDQNQYRKPPRVYFNDTSVNPHWGKGNVIRVAAGIGKVEHVTKPGALRNKEALASGYNLGAEVSVLKVPKRPENPGTETSREKERGNPRIPEYTLPTERSRLQYPRTRTPDAAVVRRPDNPREHMTGDAEDSVKGKSTYRPNYRDSRPSEGVNKNAGPVRREDYTRKPTLFTSFTNPNKSTRVPNRIYIHGNRASTSKIPSDDEYFITEKPTANNGNDKKPTVTRRMDTYVSRNPFGHITYEEQEPSNRYEETDITVKDHRKPDEDFASSSEMVSDEAPADLEKLNIRRIDIATLAQPETPDFITKQEFIDDDDEGEPLYIEYGETTPAIPQINPFSSSANEELTTEAAETNEHVQNEEKYQQDHKDGSGEDSSPHKTDDKIDETQTEERKPNPIENVMKFIKVVSDTISKNTHRSIGSKMRYLENLRDTIMMSIEQRIESQWPDDADVTRGRRRERAARGHVDFPSSEGALMSISFLTFAVFLIKLIMQVIYRYKNQAMVVTPTVFAVSRSRT